MRRRNFITLIGGAAVWPVAAQAQPSLIPVIGLVNVGTPIDSLTEAFRQGLAELGYIEGRNVVIDYRNADNRYERLLGLVTELVRRPVTLIVAITTPPALAAKAAGSTVPLVFMVADDPVKLGLVTSFNRPGGTSTGIDFLFSDLGPKQLSLLREVVPRAARIGLLINPHNSNALREPLGRPAGLPDWPGLNNQGFCCASVLSVFEPSLLPCLEQLISSASFIEKPLTAPRRRLLKCVGLNVRLTLPRGN
jgi:ABC-type uncharacterized transport system substrate-binding protein